MVASNNSIVKKERCGGCKGFILTHNKIMSCHGCKIIYHGRCSHEYFEFDNTNGIWLCWQCIANNPKKYNPFLSLSYDKHDPNNIGDIEDIHNISNILDCCQLYTHDEFNNLLTTKNLQSKSNNVISTIFNNIDGNASNFDAFLVEVLNLHNTTFSIIAIAETNVDESSKDLYNIPNYKSEYNSKIDGKKKGSGLGLYIHDELQCNRIEKLCQCSPTIESLFVEVTNLDQPMFVGVCYRPPNGSLPEFYHQIDALMKQLPQQNVIIMGDFNIDLFSDNSKFEQILYGNNFIPTISIPTHERPGCNATLIDNILINSTDDLCKSGVLESRVSHHFPVFSFAKCSIKTNDKEADKLPKYDFCQTNVDKFLLDVQSKLTNVEFTYSEESFVSYSSILNNLIDSNFITDEQLGKSRRNRLINPWISNGIIASVKSKELFYKNWKKSCSKTNLRGDYGLYLKYKQSRQGLRKIII